MLRKLENFVGSSQLVINSIQKIRENKGKGRNLGFLLSTTSLAACGGGETVQPPPPPPVITRVDVALTEGNDLYFGTNAHEDIDTIGGQDMVYAGGGDDTIVGNGNGYYTFDGGDGNDTLSITNEGEYGRANFSGGYGNDSLTGGSNDDALVGGFGNDTLTGGAGNDSLTGGFGNDTIDAGDGDDSIRLSSGDDVVTLGAGSDSITYYGQPQGHHIINDYNPDEDRAIDLQRVADLSGGDGSGVFTVADLDITDTADGALLTLSPDHSILFKGLTAAELAQEENFRLPGVVGSDGDDTLTTNTDTREGSFVVGGNGNDTITAGETLSHIYSRLQGGAGDDTITGADDPIFVYFENPNVAYNFINGGQGNDTLIGGGNDEGYTHGSSGGDKLRYLYDPAGVTANFLTGQVIDGWGDTDTISGFEEVFLSEFDDEVTTGGGLYSINSGDGADTVIQGDTGFVEVIFGETGNHFTGFAGASSYIQLESFGGDTIDSTAGVTTVRLAGISDPDFIYEHPGYTINLAEGTAQFSEGDYAAHSLIGVENVIGSLGDDTIIGNELDNILSGGPSITTAGSHEGSPSYFNPADQHVHYVGLDTFTGGGGADTFIVRAAIDFVAFDISGASIITDFEDGVDKLVVEKDAFYIGDPIIEQGTGEYANDTIIKYLIPDGTGLDPATGVLDQWFIDNPGPQFIYAVILKDTVASTITADDFTTMPSFYGESTQGGQGSITQIDLDLTVDVAVVEDDMAEAGLEGYLNEEIMEGVFEDNGSLHYDYS